MSIIREKQDLIMKLWRERVRERIPAAKEQSKLALDDSLPDYLTNLADLLDAKNRTQRLLGEAKEDLIGKVHGQHRANNSYSIDQMIDEYFVLKEVVLEVLKSRGALDVETCELVSESFQKALQVSASQFSRSLLEAQENFVLSLAHDLRNPLMVIKMQTELMEKKNELLPRATNKIKNSADKIDGMISHLLDTIKAKSQITMASGLQTFDFLQLIRQTVAQFEDLYPGIIQVKGEGAIVNWSESSIERVLDNLLSNAVKFGEPEMPITVEVRSDEDNVFFSIHNYGDPIPEKDQLTLFQRFKRSDQESDKPGWGIGLSYVKTVVEAHKGIVLVQSDDRGTIFKFELPRNIRSSERQSLETAKETEANAHK